MQETTLPGPAGPGSSGPEQHPGHRLPRRAGHGMGQRAGRGPAATFDRPGWYRPALFALLAATALLYLWDLSASGNANSFYAAAVQAGSKSWKAWFFGSLDSSNFITVDKPPGALWIMGLSARLFGYNSWSLLVPQALEGVAAVALLAATVRRVAGSAAGLLAGAVLALTPAAVLIFRFDNPDAFLVLLLVAAAYCVTRALERASMRWLTLAGVAIGFAFLTKSGQALLAVPAFALAYLVAAPASIRRRIGHLVVATLAMVVAAGWWIVAVLLVPAADRPYIGGSTDNNPLELAFGYNGLGRLLGGAGNGGGGGGAGGGNSGFGGATGLQRLFSGEMGLEISWLLPAALILLACGVWLTWRRPRTDLARASLIIWGGWLLITGATFSYMKGTIHPYYTVALAPAIAAVIAIGGTALWRRRSEPRGAAASAVLAAIVVVTCAWAVKLLGLASATAVAAIAVSVLALLAIGWVALRSRTGRRLAAAAGIVTAIAVAIPVTSWAVQTAGTPHTGSIPTAVATSGSAGSGLGAGGTAAGGRPSGTAPSGTKMGARSGSGTAERPGGTSGSSPSTSQRPGGSGTPQSSTGTASGKVPTGTTVGGGGGGGAGGGTVSSALKTALEKTTTRWAAATIGSDSAATLELETGGKAVMAIGGFTGTDPAPTLAQFKAYVAAGDITYFIATGQGAGGGGSSSVASQITSWVEAHYKSTTIGGQTVYVLTKS